MSAPFAYPERVPVKAVHRLQDNLSALLATVHAACDAGDPTTREALRWRRAAALLQEEATALQPEIEAFLNDDRESLLRHASQLRLLAQRMDGYSINFAPDADAIVEQRRLLVLTAWQIAAAASGSEAAGL